jgi:hypothetical protein
MNLARIAGLLILLAWPQVLVWGGAYLMSGRVGAVGEKK